MIIEDLFATYAQKDRDPDLLGGLRGRSPYAMLMYRLGDVKVGTY